MSGFAGFADLRAKFENRNDTPPPSRGRSPVGQESVKGSGRKIRTNFIPVERSGQMCPSIDQRESMGSNEDHTSVTEEAKDPKAGMNGEEKDEPKTNGIAAASGKQEESQELPNKEPGSEATNNIGNGNLEMAEANDSDALNPDKPVTAEDDDASPILPSDPKDEEAVSGGAALVPKAESLGALLKGSEFEAEKKPSSKISSPKKSPEKGIVPSNPSTPVKKNEGSPKSTTSKATGTPNINGAPKAKSAMSSQNAVNKPQVQPTAKPAETSSPAAKNPSPPVSERTPASPTANKSPLKQPFNKPVSPKQHTPEQQTQSEDASKPAEKDRKKPTLQKPSRLSTSTKPTQSAGPATTNPNGKAATVVPKRSGPHSPSTVKPKPRSPTRPVRLPGGATASTAASSAKTGSTVPPRPESRAAVPNPTKHSTLNKPSGMQGPPKPAAANIRTKPPRSSLPAPTTEQKAKPKPRTSIASTKAPGNDFLSRMMRPTQSSASKTHEKVEQKTPPKKRISGRPKRISDENDVQAESKAIGAEASPKEQGQEQGDVELSTNQDEATLGSTEEAPNEKAAESDASNLTPAKDEPNNELGVTNQTQTDNDAVAA
ncbi:MAG: hypothetical protein Q9178_005520 [Gyalolechia marmorata]